MLEAILPSSVAVASTRGEIEERLFPEEEELIERAVEKRRREFVSGRACARAALAELGLEPAPIGRGERGNPRWPAGIVGSITHCRGYRAAAVARGTDIRTIGVDAEPHEPLPERLIGRIATGEERRRLAPLERGVPEVHWDRLLFSAKEAVYKAWFPLARRRLGLEDVAVGVDPAQRTFAARLLVPGPSLAEGPLTEFSGRWTIADGIVVTAVAVPTIPAPSR